MKAPMDYVREGVVIPESEWVLHPAVPVGMMERHKKAQRPSTLAGLMKKTEEIGFDREVAGIIRIVPNGDKFYPVIGATRAEYALEVHGPDYTLPAAILSREADVKEMAKLFLDELVSTPPRTPDKHRIGLVTGRQQYVDVNQAIEDLEFNQSVGALTIIRKRPNGAELLKKVVAEAKRLYPKELRTIPAVVIRGLSVVLSRKKRKPIVKKWARISARDLAHRAQKAKMRHAGKGTTYSWVDKLLVGEEKE